jgi:hypothetical protein
MAGLLSSVGLWNAAYFPIPVTLPWIKLHGFGFFRSAVTTG